MASLQYVRLKAIVSVIRVFVRLGKRISAKPDSVLQIPSRDQNRTIKAHVYRPDQVQTPSPVLLNFHGSGFVLPLHGDDDFYCRHVTQHTPYTVLDIQYRLAPENAFPAALYDIEDVVKYVQSRPEEFDSTRLSIGGFSAGGNLSLAASAAILPRDTFRSLLAFYPPVDLASSPDKKTPPEDAGKALPSWLSEIFDGSYFNSLDARDPRISPFYAPAENFPKNVLIITAAQDGLADEGNVLAERIRIDGGDKFVVSKMMEGCEHAWDKTVEKGSHKEKMRDEAYDAAVEMLKR